MIKKSYFIKGTSELGKRAFALIEKEKHPPFLKYKKVRFEAEMSADWTMWKSEICAYIIHIYNEELAGKKFNMHVFDDNILIEEDDMCFTNKKQTKV